MKIVVLGAGAMGCLYGGHLAEGGNEVWLLDVWQEHVDTINEMGLSIEGASGDRVIKNIKATTKPREIGIADLVIVFVKSTITDKAIESNKVVFGESTVVLTLQNGLGNVEKISKEINEKNILAGVTAHGATLLGPGKIRHAGAGDTIIGELDGSISDKLKNIAEVMNSSNMKTIASENVWGLIWGKLIVNVGINALTAITSLKNGELVEHEETERLLELAVEEACNVAKTKGIVLNYKDPITHTKEVCKATAVNKSSMLQDVTAKRKTEIDMINGAIVREGKELGINTPVNETLTNLVKIIEKKY